MQLKTNGVGGKSPAREPRPLDRALTFLDPLLGRATLVVEVHDASGRTSHVGDDKADAREEFAEMPLDFGDDSAPYVSS